MATNQASQATKIHARLTYPVIDSDGHWLEFEPAALDYLRQVGGERIVERYHAVDSVRRYPPYRTRLLLLSRKRDLPHNPCLLAEVGFCPTLPESDRP